MKRANLLLMIFIVLALSSCQKSNEQRHKIDLSGEWQFQLDPNNRGLIEGYEASEFAEVVKLPGTTDSNQKGFLNNNREQTAHLSRTYCYVGKAWYRREVQIPEEWKEKRVVLTLERTKPTKIWVDELLVGECDNISTAQRFDLTQHLTPGKHRLTIMVDNGESVPVQLLDNSHAYTEATQTNWNGIIGEISLEATNWLHISALEVEPDVENKVARVRVTIANPDMLTSGAELELSARAWNTGRKHKVKPHLFGLEHGESHYLFELPMGKKAQLWSEFNPAMYRLEARILGVDKSSVDFGMREFTTQGSQFAINGDITFLRGKHDACVFPLTGHTPMDVEQWRDYFRVCKEYGINHCRFHSWCPPKACFEAADLEGIYLQAELPFWGSLEREEQQLVEFLKKEGVNIQREYGNHPSFVMFALGNELWGDLELMQEFVEEFREVDNRHLYALGSNNFLGYKGEVEGEDFLVTCRVGGSAQYESHTRGSFSFADAEQGGYLNNTYPNTTTDFSAAIEECTIPVISHETGQFQVYPDYAEIKKYSGVLEPRNMELFRARLDSAGMLEQAEEFARASGRWSAMLYKADIEMDLRTEGFGGFQLLDLQDYPGQGSAFVGVLDAFMESKGHISAEEWREFCSEVVPLFLVEKMCWTTGEKLKGEVKVANYSNHNLSNKPLHWSLIDRNGTPIDSGALIIGEGGRGLQTVGEVVPDVSSLTKASELLFVLSIDGTEYKNRYPLWVYPDSEVAVPEEIYIARELNKEMLTKLQEGGSVLWFPSAEEHREQTVGGLFQTDYWNYAMFKRISENAGKPVSPGTLGIVTNPEHPIFNDFPTNYHTNWQWYSIIKQSRPLIMDAMPSEFRPIVQVIDNVERNHKLGLLFELKVGEGRLLVSMSDLEAVGDKPESRQLYNSILNYMASADFEPQTELSAEELEELFSSVAGEKKIVGVANISYEE